MVQIRQQVVEDELSYHEFVITYFTSNTPFQLDPIVSVHVSKFPQNLKDTKKHIQFRYFYSDFQNFVNFQ